MQQVEPAVTLDVEDEVVLGRLLVGQPAADLQPGRVQQHVHPAADRPDPVQHAGDRCRVGQIDLVVVRGAAGRPHRLDRLLRGPQPLVPGQFPPHQHGGGPLPAPGQLGGDVRVQAVPIGTEPAQPLVRRIRFGHQVEQVERAGRGRGQVGDDGRDDAAGRAGHQEHGVRSQPQAAGPVAEGALHQPDRPPPVLGVADLHAAGVAQCLGHQQVGQRGRPPAGREVDDLRQHRGLLPLVCLHEPADRSAQRRQGALLVVPVMATQAGGGDQERRGAGQPVGHRVERLHPAP